MAKKRLLIFFAGNTLKIDGEEDTLQKVIAAYHTSKINNCGPHSIIGSKDLIINVSSVHAMSIVDAIESPQEEYIRRLNKQLKEGEGWKGEDENEL